jgi:hypothetical protein
MVRLRNLGKILGYPQNKFILLLPSNHPRIPCSVSGTPRVGSIRSVKNYLSPHIDGSTALEDLVRFLSFLIFYMVGMTPWSGVQPVAKPLPTHRITQIQNASNGHRTQCPQCSSGRRRLMIYTARPL